MTALDQPMFCLVPYCHTSPPSGTTIASDATAEPLPASATSIGDRPVPAMLQLPLYATTPTGWNAICAYCVVPGAITKLLGLVSEKPVPVTASAVFNGAVPVFETPTESTALL